MLACAPRSARYSPARRSSTWQHNVVELRACPYGLTLTWRPAAGSRRRPPQAHARRWPALGVARQQLRRTLARRWRPRQRRNHGAGLQAGSGDPAGQGLSLEQSLLGELECQPLCLLQLCGKLGTLPQTAPPAPCCKCALQGCSTPCSQEGALQAGVPGCLQRRRPQPSTALGRAPRGCSPPRRLPRALARRGPHRRQPGGVLHAAGCQDSAALQPACLCLATAWWPAAHLPEVKHLHGPAAGRTRGVRLARVHGERGHGLPAPCKANAVHGSPLPQVEDAHCAVLAAGQHGVAVCLQCAAQHWRGVPGQAPVCPLRHPAHAAAQHRLYGKCHSSLDHCGALARDVRGVLEAGACWQTRLSCWKIAMLDSRMLSAHEAYIHGWIAMHGSMSVNSAAAANFEFSIKAAAAEPDRHSAQCVHWRAGQPRLLPSSGQSSYQPQRWQPMRPPLCNFMSC